MRWAFVAGLLAYAALEAGPALAETVDERLSVRWTAPAACPDEDKLKQAIEANLGQPLSATRSQSLEISGSVMVDANGYTALLRFQSRRGLEERVLQHPDCSRLVDAAALVIALVVDPELVNAPHAAPAPVTPEPVPPVRPNKPTLAAVPAAPTPPGRPKLDAAPSSAPRVVPSPLSEPSGTPFHYPVSVFGLFGARGLPGLGAGVGADAALSRGHFELGLVGLYWLPRSQRVPSTESSEVSVAWLAAELRACGLPWLGDWRLRLCAGGGGGDVWGRGFGVSNSRTRHTAVPTISAEALLTYGRGGVSPFVGFSADWLLVQPRLGVAQGSKITEVYTASTPALRAVLGLTYQL